MSLVRSIRELAARENNGLSVRLLWHPLENAVTVSVEDQCHDECFDLAVSPDHALDAFYHPFAYASRGTHRPPAELANPVG